MQAVRLVYPSTSIARSHAEAHNLELAFDAIEDSLLETSIALDGFTRAAEATSFTRRQQSGASITPFARDWGQQQRERDERSRADLIRFKDERPEEAKHFMAPTQDRDFLRWPPFLWWLAEQESNKTAQLIAAGRFNAEYWSAAKTMYAKAFVFSLDDHRKMAKRVARWIEPAQAIIDKWDAALPDLNAVRNTLHHFEQRRFREGRHGRPTRTDFLGNELISFGEGTEPMQSPMVGITYLDDRISVADERGTDASVPIDAATLHGAVGRAQELIDLAPWEGDFWTRQKRFTP
ncbi:hypothetical protein [Rathayibacter sp. AY1A4]|uniref:hypothetical protein n=1 Tax=Rathayibacter sp. AY1A4 TaxID=2080522 RepID=UPI0011B05200|nr:hypothetical protein [Rathayibacter sp. AY1A4]